MIITRLKLGNFGKLKNIDLNLGDKLNLIYGPNEAGKTTLLAFIKGMLYGMDSRKRGIRDNDRLRFQPWHGDFGEGELWYRDKDNGEYKISRRFGGSRREPVRIINAMTGRPLLSSANPGEEVLGLGEAAFTRTICIPQMGCVVSPDRDDEIMARLMNLQQTGDEQVSFQKVQNLLDDARKQITLRSGKGKLDRLMDAQSKLMVEKETVQRLYEENMAEQLELNRLQDELAGVQEKILCQEKKLKNLKAINQYREFQDLRKRQDELALIEAESEILRQSLMCGDTLVDRDFLQETASALDEWEHLDKLARDLEKDMKELNLELEDVEHSLAAFEGFNQMEDHVGEDLVVKENKRMGLEAELKRIAYLREEKAELERKLEAKKVELGSLEVFFQLTPEMEEAIAEKEVRKTQLERLLKNDGQVDMLRCEILGSRLNTARIMGIIGLLAAAAGLLIGVILDFWGFVLALVGSSAAAIGFIQVKKYRAGIKDIETRLNVVGSRADLEKEFQKITEELAAAYRRFGASDNQEFSDLRRKFDGERSGLTVIEARIMERQELLAREDEAGLQKEYQACADFILDVISRCRCSSVEEFQQRLKVFRGLWGQRETRIHDLEKVKERINEIHIQIGEKEEKIRGKTGLSEEGKELIKKAGELISRYEDTLTRKNTLDIQMEINRKNFLELVRGRNLAEMEAEIPKFKFEDISGENLTDQEELEHGLKELNNQKIELEKRRAGLNSSINSRLKDCREISRVEEDLEATDRAIQGYRELLETLDLTKSLLEESFRELQRSFGPLLNQKVGGILSRITGGKYGDVMIDQGYQVTLKAEGSGDRVSDYFSNGTLDQVYFSLRLGIIETVYDSEIKCPLILDDSFVQYDDSRLAAVLDYLVDYAENHQVLLFTCHQREAELLKGKEFTYIELVN